MNDKLTDKKKRRLFSVFEVLVIVLLALVPLFTTFPYRVNIFLSWEGAYRLSEGQIPYRDFGMPMGYMYWVIPALFFKIFGTQLITLVKAQVFINIISGLSFRWILKSLGVEPGVRLLSVLLYCISFSFFNFWPWYNHTVIVYEMIALGFLMKYLFDERKRWLWLSLSAVFVFFSFFTKQDGGGLALLICIALLVYNGIYSREWKPLLIFSVSFILAAFAIIAPLTKYNFSYWFNHGQPPHTARFSAREIINEFFLGSQWIKFYLFIIVLLLLARFRQWKELMLNKQLSVFLLLTLGILAEAAVLQVTSYTPPDNNIFFHSFSIAFILVLLSRILNLDFSRIKILAVAMVGMMLWWSSVYWKYIQRITERMNTEFISKSATGENIVNRQTYMLIKDTAEVPVSEWTYSGLGSFNKIYMPKPTVDGINRLLNMDLVKNQKNLHVLNMTELTPLAVELPYEPDKGPDVPLWYHLGVSMFNREAKTFEEKILAKNYDLVLFEYIPHLNNFYPFRVRDSLRQHYHLADSFYAPRRGSETRGMIEVYVR